MNGQEGGARANLAAALIALAAGDDPPARWVAGADAVGALEHKANTLLTQTAAYRDLSSSLDHTAA
jgi:hypothetical protein